MDKKNVLDNFRQFINNPNIKDNKYILQRETANSNVLNSWLNIVLDTC